MVHPKLKVKYDGKLLSVPQVAALVGISVTAMWYRLEQGWPKERLFSPDRHSRSGKVVPLTPFRGAISGDLSAEEYLRRENAENPSPYRTNS